MSAATVLTQPSNDLSLTNLSGRPKNYSAKLTAAQVASYLNAHQRSAASLLAAYRTTGDPALLEEASQTGGWDSEKPFVTELRPDVDDGIAEMACKELGLMEKVVLKGTEFPSLDAFIANARLFSRAFEFLKCGRFGEAVELFQRVLSENSQHVQSYGNLALAFAGLGRRSDALAALASPLELDPDYDPARINRRVMEQMPEGEPLIESELQL